MISIDHLLHCRNIILSIAINANRNITLVLCFHQTGKNRILMAAISRLSNANKVNIFFCQINYDFPSSVL